MNNNYVIIQGDFVFTAPQPHLLKDKNLDINLCFLVGARLVDKNLYSGGSVQGAYYRFILTKKQYEKYLKLGGTKVNE